ncbi:MAG: glycosyltransferase, partial [Streptomyces sp.]|nr:glycosyltransferase [Streptomyces sp.]
MPRFSIIVPAFGVTGRLSQALDSVLAQSFGDFELIPVCDAPDSPAGAVAAAYAERHSRVVPLSSPSSGGPGVARTAGTGAARGTYLLFLDGDDVLAPGALEKIDARLSATGDVDVLYFDHERVHWWEAETSTPPLGRAPDGVFAPGQAPELTGVSVPVWSAAYRRAFVTEHRLTFSASHFTDIGWGGLVTLVAGRMAVLRSVCVRHLLRRQGDPLHTPGEHQLELLDQVDLVLTRAGELALPAHRAKPLFEQLFSVVLRTAAHPKRLPARLRRTFFRR